MMGQLKPQQIENLISHQFIGRLGCHANGKVYVIPISYVYDGTDIYAFSKEGMKLQMMRKNPNVCLQIDNLGVLDNWESVILWGTFEELNDPIERTEALILLMNRILPVVTSEMLRISPHWPFPSDHPENIDGVVYRIKVSEKTGRFERHAEEHFFAY